jgi:integrase
MAKKRQNNQNPDAYVVEPIKSRSEVKKIRNMLLKREEYRNALLFCLGINNGLRAGDLVSIKVGTVRHARIDEPINIIEQKTGKPNILVVNKVCHRILHEYLDKVPLRDSDYLFPSQKAYARKDEGKPKARDRKLDTRSVNALVKKWCQEAGIRGHFGSHTLRKTFGYIQYKEFNVDLYLNPTLQPS